VPTPHIIIIILLLRMGRVIPVWQFHVIADKILFRPCKGESITLDSLTQHLFCQRVWKPCRNTLLMVSWTLHSTKTRMSLLPYWDCVRTSLEILIMVKITYYCRSEAHKKARWFEKEQMLILFLQAQGSISIVNYRTGLSSVPTFFWGGMIYTYNLLEIQSCED
jgi:hypothetical protein